MPEDPLEAYLRKCVLLLLWLEIIFTSWLNFRQIQKIDSQSEVPTILTTYVYDIHDFRKSGSYSRAILVYGIVKGFYLASIWTTIVLCNGIYFAWTLSKTANRAFHFLPDFIGPEIRQNCIFSCFCQVVKSILMFPPSMYLMYFVEKKFGFYESSWTNGVKIYLKDALLQSLFFPICTMSFLHLFKGLDTILASRNWLIIVPCLFIYWLVFPNVLVVVSLRGHKHFRRLHTGELKTRIERLADRVNFPRNCIFVTSKFKGTSHSNAFHYGFLNFQRLVLFRTIIEGYHGVPPGMGLSPALVEAVIAHELGHYSKSHSLMAITFCQLKVLIVLLLSVWLSKQGVIYKAFGFPAETLHSVQNGLGPILPGMLIIIELILGFPLYIMNSVLDVLMQHMEYSADEFACSLGYDVTLKKALVKVSVDNCSYPDADHLYSMLYLTHPTLVDRIANIDSFSVTDRNR